eukprot:CAMPEP_0204615392 /NCGR_PEP_ID=MMETSP0717-20131115/2902_1 /ASSEMBLY_ACC=CAM_ASM_000666 /TAXON_ID=230516 /ORGANISM="Chaetoceros curvisetus" /LENGTH=71 /DNA_ID=CAMNT_0051628321 /DNA_START=199 /DNA_END=414 /DNA_ORIENTATION=-
MVHPDDFEDDDWAELPEAIKKAFEALGYTQAIWDADGDGPLEDKDWAELSAAQQAAAKTVGYTEEMWDDED